MLPHVGLEPESTFAIWDQQLEHGTDVISRMPDLPIRLSPEVAIHEWKDHLRGAPYPVLHREYRTPAGTLHAAAYQTPDWLYGERLPLYDDYLTDRSVKFLIAQPSDLDALEYLLPAPTDEDIDDYREMASRYRSFAKERGLLFAAHYGALNARPGHGDRALVGKDGGNMGGDAIFWLCGLDALLWTYDQPEFLEQFLHQFSVWNRRRMEVVLDTGVDLVFKRGWYETAPFYSPSLFRKYMAPPLREEAALAHQAGAKLAYETTTGLLPFLDAIIESGADVIHGVDPAPSGLNDLTALAQRAAGEIALWGGVSYPFHIELGTPEEVRRDVALAIEACGPNGGFILGAVGGAVHPPDARQQEINRRNTEAVIAAWREHRYV
jgi:hypothetical protein